MEDTAFFHCRAEGEETSSPSKEMKKHCHGEFSLALAFYLYSLNVCFWTNAIPTMCEDFIVLDMMPTLKTWQVAPGLCFSHVDPKSIVKSHRENLLCLQCPLFLPGI